MSKINVNLGPLQFPLSAVKDAICWPFKQLASTPALSHRVDALELRFNALGRHVLAMTGIFVIADLMGSWPADKRKRVQRAIASLIITNKGLNTINPRQNPFKAEEIQRLSEHVHRAEQEGTFSAFMLDFFKEKWRTSHERSCIFRC